MIIDDIVPVRKKYRPPSPVPDNKQMQLHGDKGLRKSQTLSGEKKRGASRSISQPRTQQATSYGLKLKHKKSEENTSGPNPRRIDYNEFLEDSNPNDDPLGFQQLESNTEGGMQSKKVVMMYDV